MSIWRKIEFYLITAVLIVPVIVWSGIHILIVLTKLLTGSAREKVDVISVNQELGDQIRRSDAKEIREWFAEATEGDFRVFWEDSPKMKKKIERIYELGAVEIHAVDIEQEEGGEYSRCIVISLPNDKTKRKKLFRWENIQAYLQGFDGVMDCGQDYIFSYWT